MLRKLLAFFGIDLAPQRFFPVGVRRRFGLFVGLGVLVFLLSSGLFLWQSSHAWFCGTCHIMQPYVQSWRESAHGQKGIECVQCHFPPGFWNAVKGKFRAVSMLVAYVTGTYDTTPFAEVHDESCMRPGCHDRRLLEGQVTYKGVHFDHKPHLSEMRRGKRLRCQSCHSQIVQGTHISVTESVCFTCHFKDLKRGRIEEPIAGCKGCHDVPAKPVRLVTGDEYSHADYEKRAVPCYKCHFDTVQGDGKVARQVCLACHNEPDRLAKFDDHEFMHKNHVTDHHVECFHCHAEIRHGRNPEPEPTEAVCNRCHLGKHDLTAQLFRGTGARGVKDMPSAMSAAHVQCIACHQILGGLPGHAPQGTYEAGEKSCVECHGKDMEGTLPAWQQEMADALKKADESLAKADAAAKTLRAPEPQRQAAQLLDDARHNVHLVRYAKGVHNLDYAKAALKVARANATKVLSLTEAK